MRCCVAACPSGAIEQQNFTNRQLLTEVEAVCVKESYELQELQDKFEPKIVGFLCQMVRLHRCRLWQGLVE